MFSSHALPQFLVFSFTLCVQATLGLKLARRKLLSKPRLIAASACSASFSALAVLMSSARAQQYVPSWWSGWIEGAALGWDICLTGLLLAWLLWSRVERTQPSARRDFLKKASVGLLAAPALVTAFGFVDRNRLRLVETDIAIPGLPAALHGLRMVQISDVHMGAFLTEREFARAIDMANETNADIALMTGDLITRRGDPLDDCLRQLARLRSKTGVLGCLGNHEIFTGTEDYVTREGARRGIRFLRHQAAQLRFGESTLNFAGVDYQPMHGEYLVGAEDLIVPGAVNILLSHNPDVFPVAARQGFDLTIGGHTHGGQINVEILHRNWNLARYFTPYVRGLYREGRASIYVSSGIGTVALPLRIGAPAEVNLLRLCAI